MLLGRLGRPLLRLLVLRRRGVLRLLELMRVIGFLGRSRRWRKFHSGILLCGRIIRLVHLWSRLLLYLRLRRSLLWRLLLRRRRQL